MHTGAADNDSCDDDHGVTDDNDSNINNDNVTRYYYHCGIPNISGINIYDFSTVS